MAIEKETMNSDLVGIRKQRIQTLEDLKELGYDVYPSILGKKDSIATVNKDFETLLEKEVKCSGRIMSMRKQKERVFCDLVDQSGQIQIVLRTDTLEVADPKNGNLGFIHLEKLDIGDIVEIVGFPHLTPRGAKSVFPSSIKLLSKSLRPLPNQWKGLTNRETILRKRYLDLMMSRENFERYELISKMVSCARQYLIGEGFLEFTTPVIQPLYGGGTAKPFKTHVNALGVDMYLSISHELYLKRLIVAGYEKVFTIGRYFRNEGIDKSHHPEFSMIETMTAYQNFEYNMDLVEGLLKFVTNEVFNKSNFMVQGNEVDFSKKWRRVSMCELVEEEIGIDFSAYTDLRVLKAALQGKDIEITSATIGHGLVEVFELKVEHTLIQPTFVYGHPVEISPLARPTTEDPRFTERFEIFIGGMECGDNWTEQNDPQKLLERWIESKKHSDDDENSHSMDIDFIEAIEYGMPPTTGIGPGIERLAMILTEQENIDDVILFPLMKPKKESTNIEIYGDI